MGNLTLSNTAGDSVVVPEEVARRLFNKFRAADAFLHAARPPSPDSHSLSESSGEAEEATPALPQEDEPLRVGQLNASLEVLQVVATYATLPNDQRTADIPKPMIRSYAESVKPHELDMVRKAEEQNYLVQLLDVALALRFEQLIAVCAAYMNERIHEISKGSPDIMTGAERVREFMHVENTWTTEEMEHLSKEMALAKKIDPHAY
ncbi:unnamed protein product [Phytomonas sp. Hart1]|nr:unnamed protein product [Phytomonas sp. Hart1]|eukprot:CCW66710.1 unnamed protein product [Phytomonas sp. isolate Hart1]